MAFAIPVMLLNLVLAWLWLQKLQVSDSAIKIGIIFNTSNATIIVVIHQLVDQSWYPGGEEKRSKEQEASAMRVIQER